MFKTTLLLSLSAFLFLACNHSNHLPPKSSTNNRFNLLDTNHNNKISFDEFYSYVQKQAENFSNASLDANMQVCDKNGNGVITPDELVVVNEVVPRIYGTVDTTNPKFFCFINKKEFSFFDKNGDHMITREELKQKRGANSSNKRCDPNLDGKISRAEATAQICGYPNDSFNKDDLNHDGFLTKKELRKVNQMNRFNYLDTNHNKSLDRNEFKDVSFFGDPI